MRYLATCLLVILVISCNNSGKENDKQKQIDSLTNEINRRDDSVRMEQAEIEKQEKIEAAIKERNSLLSKVIIDKPTFTEVAFGGFKDIRFNLFNDSKYKLDQVILSVHYLKTNGREIKSETKILSDIAPNSRLALTAPDYLAGGTSLRVTVETLLCKAVNLCYYNTADSIASNDPYRCR